MIIPHLGGLGRDPSVCCSHSPQPAQLGQATSVHGVPTPEDTTKRVAHFLANVIHKRSDILGFCDSVTLRL